MASTQDDFAKAIKGSYQGIPVVPALYVSPTTGSDSNDGLSWRKPLKTLQRAFDLAQEGAEVVLAAGDHDLKGQPVNVAAAKALTVRGENHVSVRQFGSNGQSRICNTGQQVTNYIQTDIPTKNVYGWTFKDIAVDLDGVVDGGALFNSHAVGRVTMHNMTVRSLNTSDNRYVAIADLAGGDDCAWWMWDNVSLEGVRFAKAAGSPNYWQFYGCSAMGKRDGSNITAAGPALDLADCSGVTLSGMHVEAYQLGVKLTNQREPKITGLHGESVDTMLHLIDCYGAWVHLSTFAALGSSKIVNEVTGNHFLYDEPNVFVSHGYVETRGAGAAEHTVILSGERGVTQRRQVLANIGGHALFDQHPAYSATPPGPDFLTAHAVQPIDLLLAGGLRIEYHDGSSWKAWLSPDSNETNSLLMDDQFGVQVDQAHHRWRLRSVADTGEIQAQLYLRAWASVGGMQSLHVRTYSDADCSIVATDQMVTLDNPGLLRGVVTTIKGGRYLEIEADLTMNPGEVYQLQRVGLYAAQTDYEMVGRIFKSRLTPNGRTWGKAGDLCQVAQGPDAGLWVNTASDTSWSKLS